MQESEALSKQLMPAQLLERNKAHVAEVARREVAQKDSDRFAEMTRLAMVESEFPGLTVWSCDSTYPSVYVVVGTR